MGVLRFSFGTMGSGKSTLALQIHHNLVSRGLIGPLCTRLDREEAQVSSRLGVSRDAVEVTPSLDFRELAERGHRPRGSASTSSCATRPSSSRRRRSSSSPAWSTAWTSTPTPSASSPTSAGRLFPGTARFLELADVRQELQVEARCWCGARATQNARLVDGKQVYDGDLVVLGDIRGAVRGHLRAVVPPPLARGTGRTLTASGGRSLAAGA